MKSLKSLIKDICLILDRIIPIFPKDSFYEYDFTERKIIFKGEINERRLEMQYFADFNDDLLVTRYSKYISEVSFGLKMISGESVEYKPLDGDYKNLRILNDEIYSSINGSLFNITKNLKYDIEMSSDFEFIKEEDELYVVDDLILYTMDESLKKKHLVKELSFDRDSLHRRDLSICKKDNEYLLVCREGEQSTIGTRIVLYKSIDRINYSFEEVLVDSNDYRDVGIDGLGFPVIRNLTGGLKMLFVSYWGKHFLRSKTVKYWSQN